MPVRFIMFYIIKTVIHRKNGIGPLEMLSWFVVKVNLTETAIGVIIKWNLQLIDIHDTVKKIDLQMPGLCVFDNLFW